MVEGTASRAQDRGMAWATGFTQQELRDIFNLDPDRAEDRPAIAALQASSTRLLDEPRTAARTAQRSTGRQAAAEEAQPERCLSGCPDPCA